VRNPIPDAMRRLDDLQRSRRAPAFVFGVVKKYGDDQAGQLAALLTYYGFLALFPLLLVFVTVLGIIAGHDPGFAANLRRSTLTQFPIIGGDLTKNIHGLHTNSPFALVVGIVGLLWGALGSTQIGQYAMAQLWNVPMVDRPGFVPRMLRSLLLLVTMGAFLVVSTALTGVATFSGPSGIVRAGSEVLSVIVDVGLFTAAFRILTPKEVALRELLPGALAGGIGWAVLQNAGTYLVGHELKHMSGVYGLFAIVLGLLWWMYLTAQVVLYVAEINVVKSRRLWPRSLTQPPLTEADEKLYAAYAHEQRRRPEQHVSVGFAPSASDPDKPVGREHDGAEELRPAAPRQR